MADRKAELDAKLKRTIAIIDKQERERLDKESDKKRKLLIPPQNFPSKEKNRKKAKVKHQRKPKKPYSKEYKCSKCDTITTSVSSFKRHWRNKHSHPRKYLCRNCGSVSSRYDTYLKHQKSFHADSPDYGYEILNYNKGQEHESVPEREDESVKDNVCQSKTPEAAPKLISVTDDSCMNIIQNDICNFFNGSTTHNEFLWREFPRYSANELNSEPCTYHPRYLDPSPHVNTLTQSEREHLYISEADMNMQEYIIAQTRPTLEKRRDWHFIPTSLQEQSKFPERPWHIQNLRNSLTLSYIQDDPPPPVKQTNHALQSMSHHEWEELIFSKKGLKEFKEKELAKIAEEKMKNLIKELSCSSTTISNTPVQIEQPTQTAMDLLKNYTSPVLSSSGEDSTIHPKSGSEINCIDNAQLKTESSKPGTSPPSMAPPSVTPLSEVTYTTGKSCSTPVICSSLEEGEIRSSHSDETWLIIDQD